MFQKIVLYIKNANEDDRTIVGGLGYLAVVATLYGIGIWFSCVAIQVALH